MTDVIELLREQDPARAPADPPPFDALLARLDAEPDPGSPAHRAGHVRTRRRALTVALAAVAAALAVVLTASEIGGHRTDVLAEARAAVAPEGYVVHTLARTTMVHPDGRAVGGPMHARGRAVGRMDGPVERWSGAEGRWRELRRFPSGPGMRGGWADHAYADGVLRSRFSWRRGVRSQRVPDVYADAMRRIGAGQMLQIGTADPLATVRRMLDSGEAREAGETTRDGRRLLRLVAESPALRVRRRGAGAHRGLRTTTTYLIDATTYAPVEVETVPRFEPAVTDAKTGRPLLGWTTRTTFLRYERLPLTASTERLLRLGGRR